MMFSALTGSQVCSTSLVIQPPVVTLDKAAPAAAEDAAATAAAAAAGKKGAKPGAKAAATAAKSESKPMSAAPGSAKGKPGELRGILARDDIKITCQFPCGVYQHTMQIF